ncbi:hypothetical protein JS756_00220 [Streptomyces actuosus]|uniref:Transposase n=1 Tax=Streptomyces actuosus TaxID=1885 RepID=A0ABS2VHJ5_STRAS|nr:hypothetical protein [Streptomyces actuosus]
MVRTRGSILDEEWPAVRAIIELRLAAGRSPMPLGGTPGGPGAQPHGHDERLVPA